MPLGSGLIIVKAFLSMLKTQRTVKFVLQSSSQVFFSNRCTLSRKIQKWGTKLCVFRDPGHIFKRLLRGIMGGYRIRANSGVETGQFLPQTLILFLVKEDVAARKRAAFHARVTGQIVDLRAQVVCFMRTTP